MTHQGTPQTTVVPELMKPPPQARPAPFLAALTGLVLLVVVPVMLWQFGRTPNDSSSVVLTLVLVLAGLRFTWIIGSRTRHLHEMVVWLFVYLFLGVAPFIQLRSKFPGTTPGIDGALATSAAVIVLVGCVCLLVGIFWASRAKAKEPSLAREAAAVSERRVYVLVVLALLLAVVYILQVGPASIFASRSDLKIARADSIGSDPTGVLITAGAKMGLLVAFVALMHLRRQRKAVGLRGPIFIPVLVLVTLFICVNPISSARYVFGTVFLAVLAALGAYATVNRFRLVSLASLVGLVFVFPLLDTFRRSLDATVEVQSPLASMTTGDFDAFAQIMNTDEFVSLQGVTWGNQLLGVLFFWVPRTWWPDKPIDTGSLIAGFKGYTFTNLSEPFWAELFINFGWIGLVVGMVALGYTIRRFDTRSELTLQHSRIPDILGCIIPFYLLIVLRGSLLQAMTNLLIILVCTWFVTARARPKQFASP